MVQLKKIIGLALLCLVWPILSWAQTPVPGVTGSAYAVADAQSGQILADRGLHDRVEPGALVKLMGAYLAFQAIQTGKLSLEQPLTVSESGWKAAGTRIFMQPKKPLPAKSVLQGMLVVSGNDATITVAEAVGGSEAGFVTMMNQMAQRLGMDQTHYANSTGVADEKQYTTVADLLVLTQALLRDFPQYGAWFAQKSFSYNGISQPNRNLLLFRDASVRGLAVGYTLTGGYNLVASSNRNGRLVVAIAMGTESLRRGQPKAASC
ncbi:D-alanyl-D-alanine carboxypeptidase family protein [Snodgrassella sp. CFCC 13594]|uniref:D-alanyl-D-alanine carboxypeptidase family protein n=1 Tax=Snodgrassella sp. CFCC 13594 TaxID=1775559 RepID=UPI00082B1FAE|nr:D-alanyl-D-alanine carboxypeptidase family protein [Snodgrassella sp. CFCC 13594]